MTPSPRTFSNGEGLTFSPSVFPSAVLEGWISQIDPFYQSLDASRGEPAAIARVLSPAERFVATASSFTIGTAFSEATLRAILFAVTSNEAGKWLRAQLGESMACDLDQSWIRRQYAPRHYPLWHAPHGWHQDGALKFDFTAHQNGKFPANAILPVVTCWIALNACGVDAPGLEMVSTRLAGLLPPDQLTEEAVRGRFAPEHFWKPSFEPGDALFFRGDILHRTHVTPAMTKDRTSLELRFFSAGELPERLKSDRFLPLP